MDVMFWVWLGVIVVSAIVELATMEVVSIWFTLGAVVPFILAATRAVSWVWQVVIFVCVSAILIAGLREITKKFLLRNSNEKTNLDALVGQKFRMLSRTDFETVGSLKINDVVWSAIGENQQTIEANEIVEIVKISGNKMIVRKVAGEEAKNDDEKRRQTKVVKKEGETTLEETDVEEKPKLKKQSKKIEDEADGKKPNSQNKKPLAEKTPPKTKDEKRPTSSATTKKKTSAKK